MNLILAVAYAAGYIYAWRKAFMVMFDDMVWGRPDPTDIILSAFFATLTSVIWPLWLIPITLYYVLIKKNLDAWIERNY